MTLLMLRCLYIIHSYDVEIVSISQRKTHLNVHKPEKPLLLFLDLYVSTTKQTSTLSFLSIFPDELFSIEIRV